MTLVIKWTEMSLCDLEAIGDYLPQEIPSDTERQLELIHKIVSSLKTFPGRGRKGRVTGTRELVIHTTPYIVAYVEKENEIEVLSIIHRSQNMA